MEKLLFSAPNGYIYAFDEGARQDGQDIEAVYETPWEDLGRRDLVKTVQEFYAVAEGTGRLLITLITRYHESPVSSGSPPAGQRWCGFQYSPKAGGSSCGLKNVGAGGAFMLARPQLKYEVR